MFAARRDNVRELFGGKPLAAAAQGASPEKVWEAQVWWPWGPSWC